MKILEEGYHLSRQEIKPAHLIELTTEIFGNALPKEKARIIIEVFNESTVTFHHYAEILRIANIHENNFKTHLLADIKKYYDRKTSDVRNKFQTLGIQTKF